MKKSMRVQIHLKELDPSLFFSNLSFGGECPDHLSGYPVCREEARLTPEKLNGLNLVGIAPTLASSVGSERTKDVNTLQKSIVNYGWGGLFCMA